jgi:hypothetical protein
VHPGVGRQSLGRLSVRAAVVAVVIAVPVYASAVRSPAGATLAPTPSGFSLTWGDDFNGAAGTGIDTSLWKYDTGPGSTFGTGEIETMTNSTSNVHYDGNGHLVLTALRSGSDPASGCRVTV